MTTRGVHAPPKNSSERAAGWIIDHQRVAQADSAAGLRPQYWRFSLAWRLLYWSLEALLASEMLRRNGQQSHDLSSGMVLAGKYRVDYVLGAGSMGTLFAATDLELRMRTAIKVALVGHELKHELEQRLLFEARAAAQLRGENICRVLAIGQLPWGAPFVVMEQLEGEDLEHALMRRGSLPIAEAVSCVLQTCVALAEAHARGIVHRDIKPENLFITSRPDGSSVLKVLDFGASALVDRLLQDPGGMTIGTPDYMAPERLRDPTSKNPASDIWSLGAVLYELISGVVPFQGDTVEAVCAKVLRAETTPLRRLCSDVPGALERAVARCLERKPYRRFPDVAALASTLAPFGLPGAEALARSAQHILSPREPARGSRTLHRSSGAPPAPRARLASEPFLLSR